MNTHSHIDPWYDRTIRFLIYSLAFIIPTFFSTAFYSAFSTPKLLALRFITLIIVLLWAWKTYKEGKLTIRHTSWNWLLVAYGGIGVLTTIFSTHIYSSLFGAETRFVGIFTQLNLLLLPFLVFNFLQKRNHLWTFLITLMATGSILGFYAILQNRGLLGQTFQWSQDPSERAFGTMGHSNHFGAFMGMCILISFGIFELLKSKSQQVRKYRAFIVLGIVLQAIGLFLSASRGALFATIVSALILSVLFIVRGWNHIKKTIIKKGSIIAVGIALLIVLAVIFAKPISKIPLIERTSETIAAMQSGTLPDRVSWWLSSLEMIKDKPFFGFGLSTFRDAYNLYRRTDYIVPGPGNLQDQISPESSHMEYLDIMVQQGLIGFGVFAALIIVLFIGFDRIVFKKNKDVESFDITLAVKGALQVYLLQVLVSFGVIDTLVIFYLLLGVGASVVFAKTENKEIILNKISKYSIAIITLFILSAGFIFTLRGAAAEIDYKKAILANAAGSPEDAAQDFDRMLSNQPFRYEYYQAYADFAFQNSINPELDASSQLKLLSVAIENYQKAIAVNNAHPSTFFNYAMACFQAAKRIGGDTWANEGLNALQHAIDLSPNNPLYTYQAGKVFLQLGQKEQAHEAFSKALQYRPGYMDANELIKKTI